HTGKEPDCRLLPEAPCGEIECINMNRHASHRDSDMEALKIRITSETRGGAVCQDARLPELAPDSGKILKRADGPVHVDRGVCFRITRVQTRDLVPSFFLSSQQVRNSSQHFSALREREFSQLFAAYLAGVVESRVKIKTVRTCPSNGCPIGWVDQLCASPGPRLPLASEVALQRGLMRKGLFRTFH